MVYTAHVYAFRFWFASCNAYNIIVECRLYCFGGRYLNFKASSKDHIDLVTQRLSQNYFVTSVVHLEFAIRQCSTTTTTQLLYWYGTFSSLLFTWRWFQWAVDYRTFNWQSQVCWLTQWFRGTTSSCLPSYKCSLDAEQKNSIITIGHQWRRCLQ